LESATANKAKECDMNVNLKQVFGPWAYGWVLDKHSHHSVFKGYNEQGRATFDTSRTEVGEATFRLKFRRDWTQAQPLANALVRHVLPRLPKVGFIVPMPASTQRPRQPVNEVARVVAKIAGVPMFERLLLKAPNADGLHLKDLTTKEAKLDAIGNSYHVNDEIKNDRQCNVLLVDDLYHFTSQH
jgi:predicted amidophosphoribosyltransferase